MALGKMCFAQVIEDGNLILYEYITTSTVTTPYNGYGANSGYGATRTVTNTYTNISYYIQKDGSPTVERIPHIGFRDLVTGYIKDNARLTQMVNDKSLTYGDIRQIVRTYNNEK